MFFINCKYLQYTIHRNSPPFPFIINPISKSHPIFSLFFFIQHSLQNIIQSLPLDSDPRVIELNPTSNKFTRPAIDDRISPLDWNDFLLNRNIKHRSIAFLSAIGIFSPINAVDFSRSPSDPGDMAYCAEAPPVLNMVPFLLSLSYLLLSLSLT